MSAEIDGHRNHCECSPRTCDVIADALERSQQRAEPSGVEAILEEISSIELAAHQGGGKYRKAILECVDRLRALFASPVTDEYRSKYEAMVARAERVIGGYNGQSAEEAAHFILHGESAKPEAKPKYFVGDYRNGTECRASRDGDCYWEECPQNRDGEPVKSGRHCPLDVEPAQPEAPQ